MTTTCTGCGDHQFGDPTGLCWDCRVAQPGYRARLDNQVRAGMAAEHAAHPEWKRSGPKSGDPGPYRFFWAEVVRKECPECGWATAVGFENEPGVHERIPTKCLECSALDIKAGLRGTALHIHGEPEEAHRHQDHEPEPRNQQEQELGA